MSFNNIQFLSGWIPFDQHGMAMSGRKSTLEVENSGGDLLLFEYAYPCREEERSVFVKVKIFDRVIGEFRGCYSFPFYMGFKIPAFPQKKLLITFETDQSYFRPDSLGKDKEYGLILFHLELLNKKTDPSKYEVFEIKVENVKNHFNRLLTPSREAQSLPMALLIEPSSRCNMDCVMCARSIPGHRKEDECDLADAFMPLLNESMKGVQASRIQGLGEPLMSKNFIPLINLLESNHVHVVTFNTNGYLLNEELARFLVQKGNIFEHFRISFSLDAATQEVYHKIRGKDLGRTVKNIKYLQEMKGRSGSSNPMVLINMTLSKTNIQDLPNFIQLASDLGVQVELSNLALDQSYESIQIEKGNRFQFDYKKEIVTAYPKLYNKMLRKAEYLAKKLNVTIYKDSSVTYLDVPEAKFHSWLKNLLRKSFKSDQKTGEKAVQSQKEIDPYFERLPLCLLPWSQMVISSKGDISLCCVQGPIDHLKNYSSIETAWHSGKICRIREQLSHQIFPPECQTGDCTVKRWKTRVCILHQ
jgi:MoaA/NifB/PqqE/SkfB family radical SAM enzyme